VKELKAPPKRGTSKRAKDMMLETSKCAKDMMCDADAAKKVYDTLKNNLVQDWQTCDGFQDQMADLNVGM